MIHDGGGCCCANGLICHNVITVRATAHRSMGYALDRLSIKDWMIMDVTA